MQASLNASESVGCAWHVRAMSCAARARVSESAERARKGHRRGAHLGARAVLHAEHALGDHLPCVGPDDVDAQDTVCRGALGRRWCESRPRRVA